MSKELVSKLAGQPVKSGTGFMIGRSAHNWRGRLAWVAAGLTAVALPVLETSEAWAKKPRPNVIVIVTDDQRADGTMQVMPETRKAFSRGGTDFTNAVTTTPTCCPSRASIMSGRYMHNHGVFHNANNQAELNQLDKKSLVAHHLDAAGYRTGIIGKYLNSWPTTKAPPDYDDFAISQGPFFNTSWNVNGEIRTVPGYSTTFVRRQAKAFIRRAERRDRKPWFLYVAPFAPHGTLGPGGVTLEPEPRYANVEVGPLESNPARMETSPADLIDKPPFWRNIVAGYTPGPGQPGAAEAREGQLRMLLSVDDMVAAVMKQLRKRKEGRRTLAVYVSDNGLFWGEHGSPPMKDMPYSNAVDVPLFLRWPHRVRADRTDTRTAANIDVAPTILDAARVRGRRGMDGRSLLESWQRPNILLEYPQTGRVPTWASLYQPGEEQFTEYYAPNGAVSFREYHDLAADPWQLQNMLNPPLPGAPAVGPLAAQLAAVRTCAAAECR